MDDMRIRKAGRVCDNLWYLGREESGIYILEGADSSIIISGGLNYIVPDILRQLHQFNIDETRIHKLLILHSHFDHIGLVPFFTRRYKRLAVYASSQSWEVLTDAFRIRAINAMSRLEVEKMNIEADLADYDLEWRCDVTGSNVSEGDVIDLGGISLEIIATPGHSDCSLSAYVPSIKALFPSDSAGIPYKDTIMPTGNTNYTQYLQNLNKLASFEVDYFCADHYGYVSGNEARHFIEESIKISKQFLAMVRALHCRTGSIDKTVKKLVGYARSLNRDYFLPPEILAQVYRPMVTHIITAMEGISI